MLNIILFNHIVVMILNKFNLIERLNLLNQIKLHLDEA